MKRKLLIALTTILGTAALPLHAAVITFDGAFTPSSSDTVDLTSLGTTDWNKFDLAEKVGATNISAASGASVMNPISGNQPTFTWSDGQLPNTSGSTNLGIRSPGGGAMSFTIATANVTNYVSVWFGAFSGSSGTFTVTLPGATTFTDSTSFVFAPGDKVMRYDFTLTPDTIGDVATFSWVSDGSGILSAATLQSIPEPSVGALVGVAGAIALLCRRRRRAET